MLAAGGSRPAHQCSEYSTTNIQPEHTMDLNRFQQFDIRLRDSEVEAFGEILRLAHTQLRNSPAVQMRGNPCQKQAGLSGPALFNVKTMMEKMGHYMGVDCPYDAIPDADSDELTRTQPCNRLLVITHG